MAAVNCNPLGIYPSTPHTAVHCVSLLYHVGVCPAHYLSGAADNPWTGLSPVQICDPSKVAARCCLAVLFVLGLHALSCEGQRCDYSTYIYM